VRPPRPSSVQAGAASPDGSPTRSAKLTATPITPSAIPTHCHGPRRSQRNPALIAATSSGEEHAIRAVVPAGMPAASPR
jgi:hypothetical protein